MEKHSKFWGYQENSFFTKNWVRNINYVIVVLLLILLPNISFSEITLSIKEMIWWFIIAIILGPLIAIYLLEKTLKYTEFFEWDFTERKKKTRFMDSIP
jgi:predicted ferric reductase